MADVNEYYDELAEVLVAVARSLGGKEALISMLVSETGASFSKSISYRNLIKRVQKESMEKDFCRIVFDASNFKEAVDRRAIYCGLSLLSVDEVIKVADYLSHKGSNWRFDRSSGTKATNAVANNESLEKVNESLRILMSNNTIELLTRQNKRWVVGPMGISRAVENRKPGQVWGLMSLIKEEIPNKTFGVFLAHAKWVPREATLSDSNGAQYKQAEFMQIVLRHGTDSDILATFNELVLEGILDFKSIRTYGFNTIGTPCGVFQRKYGGVNNLAGLMVSECAEEQLKIYLSQKGYFSSDVRLGTVELAIKDTPMSILCEYFGWSDLVRIAKKLDLVRPEKLDKSRMAEIIAIRLGFELPVPIEGLTKILDGVVRNTASMSDSSISAEELDGMMARTYRSIEVVLKDILHFYIGFLWPESLTEEEMGERRETFNQFCKDNLGVVKADGLDGLTLGELKELLQKLTGIVKSEPKLQQSLDDKFQRKTLIPNSVFQNLEESFAARKFLAHDKGHVQERKNTKIEKYVKALSKIQDFLREIKMKCIYPYVIRVRREVTDEYGRRYVEAIDDENKPWLIYSNEYLWPNQSYMMHTVTTGIAVDPYLSARLR